MSPNLSTLDKWRRKLLIEKRITNNVKNKLDNSVFTKKERDELRILENHVSKRRTRSA